MHVKIPHKFSQFEATQRVKKALDMAVPQMKKEAALDIHEERWENNVLHFDFTAQKQHISGTLMVDEKQYVIDAKLPLMMRLFEGRIEREIAEQVKKLT